jgi:C4-dicarboxylate-specific signal transduction histidine kinase
MNNDLCISQTYSNDNVKTRLHDTYIVMNKGEINTGESNENENESVVSKNCCFKVKFVPF